MKADKPKPKPKPERYNAEPCICIGCGKCDTRHKSKICGACYFHTHRNTNAQRQRDLWMDESVGYVKPTASGEDEVRSGWRCAGGPEDEIDDDWYAASEGKI